MDGIQKNRSKVTDAFCQDVSAIAAVILSILDLKNNLVRSSGAAIAPIIVCQKSDCKEEHSAKDEGNCCSGL